MKKLLAAAVLSAAVAGARAEVKSPAASETARVPGAVLTAADARKEFLAATPAGVFPAGVWKRTFSVAESVDGPQTRIVSDYTLEFFGKGERGQVSLDGSNPKPARIVDSALIFDVSGEAHHAHAHATDLVSYECRLQGSTGMICLASMDYTRWYPIDLSSDESRGTQAFYIKYELQPK